MRNKKNSQQIQTKSNYIKKSENKKRISPDYTGLVVFDVDGVILQDIFLKKIVKYRSIINYLKMLMLGFRYYRKKITFSTLLDKGYRLAEGIDVQKAHALADEIKRATHIHETVNILHKEGYYVSLISAGIPNFILRDLSKEIGADHCNGINIKVKGSTFVGVPPQGISKVKVVEKLLKRLGMGWENVVSVADDPNNLELLKKSGLGIGFNPAREVRQNVDVVVDGHDFLEIIPYIIPEKKLPQHISREYYSWKREIFRKSIHFLGCAFPFLAVINKSITLYLLLITIIGYIISEILRFTGISLSPFSHITRRALRHSENSGLIFGPISLGIGIALTIYLFDFKIYTPAVLIVSISDSLSALVGKRFGKVYILGMKNKTLQGTIAFFISAFLILITMYPLSVALITAIFASLIELLPYPILDNLLIPLGTAFFLHFVLL